MKQDLLAEAMQAIQAGDPARAERLLRSIEVAEPDTIEAMRLLASIASAKGFAEDAERLLRRAVTLAPSSVLAHADLASLLCRLERRDEAMALLEDAIRRLPHSVWPLSIKAAVLSAERMAEEAVQAHHAVAASAPEAAVPWMNYGLALKTVGRTEEAVVAYRRSLELDPANGPAWWGLANLRTVPFSAQDAALMTRALQNQRDPLQHAQLQFALGKALGDIGDYEASFRCYADANQRRGTVTPYDPQAITDFVSRSEAIFTRDFFARLDHQACKADNVIFIVGMPRSGSTLVEQILASHPMIEGAGELFELPDIAMRLAGDRKALPMLPNMIARLGADQLQTLGEAYLRSTQRHRRTNRPFFTDKLPSNWQLTPLIRLILPNAKIIDVRRNPLACCFSVFTTYFNRNTSIPTNLTDLARYYQDYVRLMAHLDAAAPGSIYRLHHERLVENLEFEVRRLLEFLELPFDAACLRFHETQRPIHTPSAQQVRQPINRKGLHQWRNYEAQLETLKRELSNLQN